MEIKYLGWQSFKIRGKEAIVLTQPFEKNKTGILFPKTKAEIILSKNQLSQEVKTRISSRKRKTGPVFFSGPGEYEAERVEIIGSGQSFWFRLENRGICWLNEKNIADLKSIPASQTDILLIGLEKTRSGWSNNVKQLIDYFSPFFIIPFPNFSLSEKELLVGHWSKDFLDLVDEESLKPADSLKIPENEILEEEKEVVILKPLAK